MQIPSPETPGAAHHPQCACVRHVEHWVNEPHGAGQRSRSSESNIRPQMPPTQYSGWYADEMHSSSWVDHRHSSLPLFARQSLHVLWIEQGGGHVLMSFDSWSPDAAGFVYHSVKIKFLLSERSYNRRIVVWPCSSRIPALVNIGRNPWPYNDYKDI